MGTEYRYQNIAYRDLTELPQDLIERTAKYVEELDLTANRISDLRFLIEYQSLKSLVLDHNFVTSHVKIADMPSLHTLWVNHNRIDNLSVFISTLAKKCPNLKYLSMMNNKAAPSYFNNGTFQQYIDYRYFVISRLPKLEVLDDKKIDRTERSEAERIYKPVRKRVKKKHITGD
ncbi:leucine-rich melanocyte differentiation-associated protein-like [Mercenaria mercenaria]|uniref:leucine-rich melanocyte differentiation-associated protein-like n=1 Tax=Mercenaria mercenaria TaxID=6596 RepID=UPI00234EE3CB|nr:leucine-rich melanocyte differentiation-associated protein-like [Mercenaria mercenaria]